MSQEFRTVHEASTNALILNAKHNSDEDMRKKCGRELVSRMCERGEYQNLLLISRDPAFHSDTQDAASLGILSAVFNHCKISGNHAALLDVASDRDMPPVVRLHAGAALVERNLKDDAGALSGIAHNPAFHEDVRLEAGHALMAIYMRSNSFSGMLSMATDGELPYGVRKNAGLMLIESALEAGNYPILLRFSAEKLPVDIIIALEGKVDAAASKAIEAAYAEGDAPLLESIASDSRLSAHVREQAALRASQICGDSHASGNAKPMEAGRHNTMPDCSMASEMTNRLARAAGAISSRAPPAPKPEGPLKR